MLRGGLLGGAGLAAAALIGCGDDDDDDAAPAGGGGATATAAGGQTTPAPTTGAIKRGGTFRDAKFFSITDVPDPHTSTAIAWVTWTWMGEAAVQWSNDATEILPVLVESWEYSPDGLTLTLNAREGVKWHNKPPVTGARSTPRTSPTTSRAIAGKLGLAIDEGKVFHRKSGLVGMIDAVPVDNRTVKVSFEFPSAPFMAGLTNGRNGLAPREFPEQVPFDYGTIVGTGAWGSRFLLERGKGGLHGEPGLLARRPALHGRRRMAVGARPSHHAGGVLAGADRVGCGIHTRGPRKRREAGGRPGADRLPVQQLEPREVQCHPSAVHRPARAEGGAPGDRPPRARRRAARQRLLRHYRADRLGLRDAIKVPELETLPGWRREKGEDIAEAKRLMDAAGFPSGELEFGILASATAASVEVPVRVIDMLQTVWPDMQPAVDQAGDNASFGQRQGKAEFDVVSYTNFAEGDAVLDAQTQMHTDGGRNYGKFSDPKTDELVEKALRQIDDEERRETLLELQHYIIEEQMPAAPTYISYAAAYQQPWVRGFEPTGPSGGSVSFDYGREAYKIWLDK